LCVLSWLTFMDGSLMLGVPAGMFLFHAHG
jgi:hypothetical protein